MADQDKLAIAMGEFEKVARLGLPPLRYTDGPNGIQGPDTVTAFPAALAMAAAFDEQLAAAFGAAIAEEARDTGSNVLLGPAVDIARAPLGGRLPESMGHYQALAVSRYRRRRAVYEDIYVGYRWYDEHGQQPLFPFGHGLSYSDFHYASPQVSIDPLAGSVTVAIQLTNTGARHASEVAQLYLAFPATAAEPPQQLRGFQKVRLPGGGSTTVTFQLATADFAIFDENSGEWLVQDGTYQLRIGRSCRDPRATADINIRAGRLAELVRGIYPKDLDGQSTGRAASAPKEPLRLVRQYFCWVSPTGFEPVRAQSTIGGSL
jgi:hypothetical protein